MSKGKFQNGKSKMSMKPLALLLAAVLLVGATIGGTLAWLQATTKEVENTFTDSDIGVTLEETKENFKMIPGHTIDKDPKVSVTTGSEDAWLFVKVTKSANYDTYLTHVIADGWELVENDGIEDANVAVYGRKVIGGQTGEVYSVLKDDQVKTLETVTKEMMNKIKDGTVDEPTLTFQAYAVQLWKTNKPADGATDEVIEAAQFTAAEAWEHAKNLTPKTETETPAPSESEGATNE